MIKTYQKKLFIGTIIIEGFCPGEKKSPKSKKNILALSGLTIALTGVN